MCGALQTSLGLKQEGISVNDTTNSAGHYSFTGYISASGVYYLRVAFDGPAAYGASVSPPITVTVVIVA